MDGIFDSLQSLVPFCARFWQASSDQQKMTANESFKHTPLDLGKTQIRLFVLSRTSPDGLLTGKIRVWDLEDCPEYSAVSYTWGPPTPVRQISIEGRSFTIRENLWQFLSASESDVSQWLWIDQICIDQSAMDERNHQVKLMAEIYENAEQVLIWLGIEADGSGEAIDAINTPPGQGNSRREMVSRHAEKVQTLFRRPYWYRLWILQEIFMAKEILVVCGDKTFPWETLGQIFTPGAMDAGIKWFPPVDINRVVLSLIKEKACFRGPEYRLCYVIQTFADSECQNPRDKVFGLLSLVRDSEVIPVEYAKTPREVFFVTIQKIVNHESSLDIGELFRVSKILRNTMLLADISDTELFLFIEEGMFKMRYEESVSKERIKYRSMDGNNNKLLGAASSGQTGIVSLLLERDADHLYKDYYNGPKALLYAASNGLEAAISILITKGVGLEAKDREGRTPLSLAAGRGEDIAAALLLDKGADILSKDCEGHTPLWWAEKYEFKKIAKLLLERGIILEIKDNEFRDHSLVVASRFGLEDMVREGILLQIKRKRLSGLLASRKVMNFFRRHGREGNSFAHQKRKNM